MTGPWTWQLVMVSEPEGGAAAGKGYAELAATAEKIGAIVDSLRKVPWKGEAADAFFAYLDGLRKSATGAHDVTVDCQAKTDSATAGLAALQPTAEETAQQLNQFVTRAKELDKDGTTFGESIELMGLRAQAQGALERVRSQREELMSALAQALHVDIDALANFKPPTAPDASGISDPAQRAMVQKLSEEVNATLASLGDTERARDYATRIANASTDMERLMLLQQAADELSAAELDNLIDNLDPDQLAAAIDGGILGFGLSDEAQRELYNKLAEKLDLDSLNGLAEMLPDDPWHPDPYKELPGINDELGPDGWLQSWEPLPDAGQEVTPQSINPEDVQQRGLGDCYLQSNLYALAQTEEGRQLLANNIHLNENGTYTVTLYDEDGNKVPVTVTPDTPVTKTGDGWTSAYDDNRALWTQLYEKAFAQVEPEIGGAAGEGGGYPGINGGFTDQTLERLTGHDVQSVPPSTAGGPFGQEWLHQAEQSDQPITVSVNEDFDPAGDGPPVHGGHAYTLDHVDWNSEPPTVHLRNPWGFDHVALPMNEFQQLNGNVHVGSLK
jgi:calpain family cysteine protease